MLPKYGLLSLLMGIISGTLSGSTLELAGSKGAIPLMIPFGALPPVLLAPQAAVPTSASPKATDKAKDPKALPAKSPKVIPKTAPPPSSTATSGPVRVHVLKSVTPQGLYLTFRPESAGKGALSPRKSLKADTTDKVLIDVKNHEDPLKVRLNSSGTNGMHPEWHFKTDRVKVIDLGHGHYKLIQEQSIECSTN